MKLTTIRITLKLFLSPQIIILKTISDYYLTACRCVYTDTIFFDGVRQPEIKKFGEVGSVLTQRAGP